MKTKTSTKIFVIEDDPMYQRMIKYVMELNPDHEVHVFSTGKECIAQLHLEPDLISLDYNLPDIKGEDLLIEIKNYNPDALVIILSGQQDIATAVKLLKDGAYDYITKDEDTKDRLVNSIAKAKKQLHLQQEVAHLKTQLNQKFQFDKSIIGSSTAMQRVFKLLKKAVMTNITVSVTGETGTGKEVIAKAIHYNSSRKNGPFIAVNMSAIPKELLESELFGYEKGAFTGANTRKKGQFELADKGTLFLDEIAEMDLNIQAKLLRAIQEREVRRVGGEQSIKYDARILIATHKDLAAEVRQGNFREDLYYRLLGLNIPLPPLRERGKDIILLAQHFLSDFLKNNPIGNISFSKEAKNKLLSYSFPGNVRELKAIVDLSAIMATEDLIQADDIQFNSIRKEVGFLTQEMSMESYKQKIVHFYLQKYENDVLLVAKKLDIGKSTIYRMLKENASANVV